MGSVNSKLSAEIAGIAVLANFATAANAGAANKDAVQLMIDTLSLETADISERIHAFDEMTPACRNALIAYLTSLKSAVVNTA